MPEYLAPGTYVEEVRGDVVPIEGVGTSTAGFVGLTERGPLQPTLVTSWLEYQRRYGDVVPPRVSVLPLSVQGFFANGGQRVYIARITRKNATRAEITLDGDGAPKVRAVGPGAHGNRIWVQVSKSSMGGEKKFRLTIYYYRDRVVEPPLDLRKYPPDVTEEFDDLSADPQDSRFASTVVNASSYLVALEWPTPTPGVPTIPEQPEPKALADGGDGEDPLTAEEFEGTKDRTPDKFTGLGAIGTIDEVAILAVPDAVNTVLLPNKADRTTVVDKMLQQCRDLHDRFAILDVEPGQANITANAASQVPSRSEHAAIYYPHLRVLDPTSRQAVLVPPSGFVAGVYAFNDTTRGVHKAPANYEVRGILTSDIRPGEGPLEFTVGQGQQAILNPLGINVIRDFRSTGRGVRVWGARTISDNAEWRYINVRRLFTFVEESVDKGLQWVVFEPNSEPTWARVRRTVDTFLERVWRDGALMGGSKQEAYFVRCDRSTMTEDDINNGRLICLVGMAPVRPAEFVILRFSQKTVEAAA
ncbi:phage tail sheath family protein [Streptoalloteichus hindustanus]|uniref:Tail sheath protein C-terminal domain-containing protein n=1 Tax=Streptoalloteichus hindustanus TaxID=2017 RepID=A0A1M5CL98_STRHI|nr:phage tail sheath C-terminal domain-containing protein [Streptoalloteichus hindustanus]SHF55498.1 hypothetical protein SAMN05444320_10476 [Streptoalloteichus hindustanus]